MPKIKVVGLEKISKKLKEGVQMDDVKHLVRKHGSNLQDLAQTKADFKGHYEWVAGQGKVFKKPSGTLKRSIGLDIKDGGLVAEVEPGVEYAPYVELGTRFMDAQPYLKPAFNEQKIKFRRDMEKLVK